MPTLPFAPAGGPPYVPGLSLSTPAPLLFSPAIRTPYVPGFLLLNAIEEPLRAVVSVLSDIDTPIAEFTLGDAFPSEWDWQTALSDVGAGRITLQADDPANAAFDTDEEVLVAFYYNALLVFRMLVETDTPNEIDDETGESVEVMEYAGRGVAALFDGADIDPTNGPNRTPPEEDRFFGWVNRLFDHSGWAAAQVDGTVDYACQVAGVLLVGFTDALAQTIEDIREKVDGLLPTRDVLLVAPQGTGGFAGGAPVGDWYGYEDETINPDLNIAEEGDYVFYGIADDAGDFYVDGQLVTSISGVNWLGVSSAAVTLSAGPHSVAFKIHNADLSQFGIGPGSANNGTKGGWLITSESANNLFDPADKDVTPIASTSTGCVVLAYPATVPGQTVTKTLRIVIEEAQARGQLLGITLGFTDDTFTDGSPAPPIPDLGTKVGNSVLAFLMELTPTYIDWVLDPATLELQVWEKGTKGVVRSATFHEATDPYDETTGNLGKVRRTRERRRIKRALVRWRGGWTSRSIAGPGVEGVIEVGALRSIEEVRRVVDGQLAIFSLRREQVDFEVRPRTSAECPGSGFVDGDYVTIRGELERVIATTVGVNTDSPDAPDVTITARDLILTPEERLARDMRAVL